MDLIMKNLSSKSSRTARAFTLVELLVVIGIIAVLISFLLPALNAARRSANNVYCKSNLQQINVATRLYVNDNRDRYPADQKGPVASTYNGLLGRSRYRRGPGQDGVQNYANYGSFVPSTDVETMGLPAVYDKLNYLRVKSGNSVWICPSAVDWMKQNGNTYQWSMQDDSVTNSTSVDRTGYSNRLGADAAKIVFVRDNTDHFPGATNIISTGTPTYNIPIAQRGVLYRHRSNQRFMINVLYLDGHIGRATLVVPGNTFLILD